jgi:hypothetical protein
MPSLELYGIDAALLAPESCQSRGVMSHIEL